MLILTATLLLCFALFLLGALIIGLIVTTKHGDRSASYKLYAVRDKLIGAAVFEGVPRDDPWLDAMYENVNSILVHSNLLGGPKRWPVAVAVGEYQAKHPRSGKTLQPLPADRECPEPLEKIGAELRDALHYLGRNHMGILLQLSAKKREERRLQKEKAKKLLNMMGPGADCHAPAQAVHS